MKPVIQRYWKKGGRWNVSLRHGSVVYVIICNEKQKRTARARANQLARFLTDWGAP